MREIVMYEPRVSVCVMSVGIRRTIWLRYTTSSLTVLIIRALQDGMENIVEIFVVGNVIMDSSIVEMVQWIGSALVGLRSAGLKAICDVKDKSD